MPVYQFYSPSKVAAGSVDSLVVCSPFDPTSTWNYVVKVGLPFPPGVNFKCVSVAQDGGGEAVRVICFHISEPQLTRQHVASGQPSGAPVGAPSSPLAPFPIASPRGARGGDYEDLGDAGVAASADSMFGDSDPMGGTYTDTYADGREIIRPKDNRIVSQPPPGVPR